MMLFIGGHDYRVIVADDREATVNQPTVGTAMIWTRTLTISRAR